MRVLQLPENYKRFIVPRMHFDIHYARNNMRISQEKHEMICLYFFVLQLVGGLPTRLPHTRGHALLY